MHWIVYVDLDAFYVSCELRRRPDLAGKPVIVGPDPSKGPSRGVVLSASYEARAFGVKSAQPVAQAGRLCPEAVWIPPDFSNYESTAEEVRELLRRHAPRISVFSIDEAAFATETTDASEVERLGQRIREEVRHELNLPCSLGIAPFVTVAKIACDRAKPGGVRVVGEEGVTEFLAPLNVRSIPGVGPKTAEILGQHGIETIGDLARNLPPAARKQLGSFAASLVELARGRPRDRELPPESGPRSRSVDRTFSADVDASEEGVRAIEAMAVELGESLERQRLSFQTISVAVRWSDFSRTQRSRTLTQARSGAEPLEELAPRLFQDLWAEERAGRGRAARTISLRVERLRPESGRQLTLDRSPLRRPPQSSPETK